MREGFYLVCYDVTDNNRRNQVMKLLKAYGLRVQQSVFECVLTVDQLEFLERRIRGCVKESEDQVRFYPMSAHTRRKVLILGKQPEVEVDDDVFIV